MSRAELVTQVRWQTGTFVLNVDHPWQSSGVTVLFGPSGAGKTSLLRAAAGFLRPHQGRVSFGDQVWFSSNDRTWTRPHHRRVGYLHQRPSLFSHGNVEENLAFAERRASSSEPVLDRTALIEELRLGDLLMRPAAKLSGGEQQRVALARMLLSAPQLVLMDEPFAALDRTRKEEIFEFLNHWHEKTGVPIIFTSHDHFDVRRFARRAVLMREGCISAEGTPGDLASLFGEHAHGAPGDRFLRAIFDEYDTKQGLSRARVGEAKLELPYEVKAAPGDAIAVRIAAEDVALSAHEVQGISIRNQWPVTLSSVEEIGTSSLLARLALGDQEICSHITRASWEEMSLSEGQRVWALVKTGSLDR